MTRRSIFWWGVVGCVAIVAICGNDVLAADATAPAVQEAVDFGDELLIIWTERTVGLERVSQVHVLRNARLVRIGNQLFVRGTPHVSKYHENDMKYTWASGADFAAAWDVVDSFCACSAEQYDKYLEAYRADEE